MHQMQDYATRMALQQHSLNVHTNGANWVTLGRPWWRAIWIECAELMAHYGTWEWWKKTEPDMPQVRLEMVDIFHFGLSQMIEERSSMDAAVTALLADLDTTASTRESADPKEFIRQVEFMAKYALTSHTFSAYSFLSAWAALGSDFKELYQIYMGKNVLNLFRQKYGYKEGRYHKNWGGKEDNWHLVNIIADTPDDVPEAEFFAEVEKRLKEAYFAAGYGASAQTIAQRSANY